MADRRFGPRAGDHVHRDVPGNVSSWYQPPVPSDSGVIAWSAGAERGTLPFGDEGGPSNA